LTGGQGGTVAAIVVAIAVASQGHRAQQRLRIEQARAEEARVPAMCAVFGSQLTEALKELLDACERGDFKKMARQRMILNELAAWPDSVQIDRLSPDALGAFLTLRRLCARAMLLINIGPFRFAITRPTAEISELLLNAELESSRAFGAADVHRF
jgi:hypothetical protein